MEFLNDGYRCQGGWLLEGGEKVDYVIDARLFGNAIPLPSPSRSHSLSFSLTILPSLPQLSALKSLPSVAAL